jgi:FtsZ-interacting cell division protein ZipA
MTQKMAVILSATLSAFVLVIISGVGGFMAKSDVAVVDSFSQQEVEQLIAERDAAYEQVIAEANRQLAAVQSNNSAEGANTSTGSEASSAYMQPEMAALMASQLKGLSLMKSLSTQGLFIWMRSAETFYLTAPFC